MNVIGFRAALEEKDIRFKVDVQESVIARLNEHSVKSFIMIEKVFGCPHEEGIDYPDGEVCPKCPFWNGRDRFTELE